MKTPDYLSYDRYKKKKDANPKHRLALFVGTFIISLGVFLFLAQAMAPEVDVSIGDEPELEEKNIGLGVKQFVDSRLKSIDMDDLGRSVLHQSEELKQDKSDIQEEKIELPSKSKKANKNVEEEQIKTPIKHQEEPAVMPAFDAPRPNSNDLVFSNETSKGMIKVYVGKYSSATQAKVAKDILMDSGLDVSPFIKNLNGVYTLQIGSFTDRARALEVANELSRNGFPARLIQE